MVRARAGANGRNAPDSRVRNRVLKSWTKGSSQAVPTTTDDKDNDHNHINNNKNRHAVLAKLYEMSAAK